MKFDINDYKGKIAMHCKTKAEAEDFCKYMHNIDASKWGYFLTNTRYNDYKSNTTYNVNSGLYGSLSNFIKANFTILEWSDFMNKKFTKADLRTGDVIKRRNGEIEISNCELGMFICKDGGWNDLDDIKEDLTYKCKIGNSDQWDIIEVRRPQVKAHCCFNAHNYGTLVYERKEPEEMTLEQVCKELGREIKIIK